MGCTSSTGGAKLPIEPTYSKHSLKRNTNNAEFWKLVGESLFVKEKKQPLLIFFLWFLFVCLFNSCLLNMEFQEERSLPLQQSEICA